MKETYLGASQGLTHGNPVSSALAILTCFEYLTRISLVDRNFNDVTQKIIFNNSISRSPARNSKRR